MLPKAATGECARGGMERPFRTESAKETGEDRRAFHGPRRVIVIPELDDDISSYALTVMSSGAPASRAAWMAAPIAGL